MEFAVPQSLIGYLNQLRYALLLAVTMDEIDIYLERADDVEAIDSGGGRRLVQLKHPGEGATLSDASPDLWKTLRVWCDAVQKGAKPSDTKFVLITTATASEGSAATLLGPGTQRDPDAALRLLETVATSSKNVKLKSAISAFTTLAPRTRRDLLAAVQVLDNSPEINASREALVRALRLSVDPQHRGLLADRIEGWWFDQCVRQLSGRRGALSSSDVASKIVDLARDFRPNALPVDYLTARPDDDGLWTRLFVQQLKAIDIATNRIEKSIVDYYRAFVQRSRWTREYLLVDDELELYDDKLVDEWDRERLRLEDEHSPDRTAPQLKKSGKALLGWMERSDFRIRSEVSEAYVMRGSFHILADRDPPRVWWHPQFATPSAARGEDNEETEKVG